MLRIMLLLGLLPALGTLVSAQCALGQPDDSDIATSLGGQFNFKIGDIVTTPQLCASTGPGTLTWAMVIDEEFGGITGTIPRYRLNRRSSPDPGFQMAGGNYYMIMDNTCKLLGTFEQDATKQDCHNGATIEAPYLKYVLEMSGISADVGDPEFSFNYANGFYSKNVNQCGCASVPGGGIAATVGCKCAFSVDGQPTK